MRKLVLIPVFVLASAAAQAGQSRGLIVAANDERIESVQPDQPKADVKPEVSKPVTEAPKPVTEAPAPAKQASNPGKKASRTAHTDHARNYATADTTARSSAPATRASLR